MISAGVMMTMPVSPLRWISEMGAACAGDAVAVAVAAHEPLLGQGGEQEVHMRGQDRPARGADEAAHLLLAGGHALDVRPL
ncbi:hypothetical protein LJB71_00025 [Thermomonas sp. S9]|uniref:hypothetical protein n=1 Tax=Thermomonas sp. S9 TaxID=2885203 RepID=UPI00216AFEF6|nr:hypothetical protein [Thermomonas sp. S9]MCR6494795.1 hypothetical protein [Thermomonas sp. S9]